MPKPCTPGLCCHRQAVASSAIAARAAPGTRWARPSAPEQELCGAGPAVCTHCGDAEPLQPSQLSPSHCRLVSCPRAASTRTQTLTDARHHLAERSLAESEIVRMKMEAGWDAGELASAWATRLTAWSALRACGRTAHAVSGELIQRSCSWLGQDNAAEKFAEDLGGELEEQYILRPHM